MIKLNNRDFPWEEGMTVESVMRAKRLTAGMWIRRTIQTLSSMMVMKCR